MAKLISSVYSSTAKYVSPKAERRRLRSLRRSTKHGRKDKKPYARPIAGETKEQFAARMRANPTPIEKLLDMRLRRAVQGKYTIKRQYLQSGYILDFYIPELRLCFEADGRQHNATNDAIRDGHILKCSIRTIRLTGTELRRDGTVVDEILRFQILEAERRILRSVYR